MPTEVRTEPVRQQRLEPWLDLQPHLENLEVVSLSLGRDDALYVLAIVPRVDHTEKQARRATYRKSTADRASSYVVLRCNGTAVNRVEIVNQSWDFDFVQPLPDDELLLVGSQCGYTEPDDYDRNGHVFNLAGVHQRAFLLGDGIEDVQTTGDGRIWVSYFDEGIVGNWIGSSGLVCFDRYGHTLYTYSPPSGLGYMVDCYALNVAGDHDTWCYYYDDFPLVHLLDHQVEAVWECPIRGSHGFVLYRDMVLMRGGYPDDRYTYHLLILQPERRMQELMRYTFVDVDNVPMADYRVAFRASSMVILNGTRCYRTGLPDLSRSGDFIDAASAD